MAGVTISLTHHFDSGETSTSTTQVGALSPTDAAILEQTFLHLVTQGLLRIGAYNASQRDAEFAAKLNVTQQIMGLKPPTA